MRTLPAGLIARLVRTALLEDIGPGDLTCEALIPHDLQARGVITAGSPLILAGLEPAQQAFQALDPDVVFRHLARAGDSVAAEGTIMEVEGKAAGILAAERTALNFLGRLSGIATMTRRCVDSVAETGATIYDTRKTTPGLRLLEKDAVSLGGGVNHRFGLFDAVLIKDNHLVLAGGPGAAVRKARELHGSRVTVEVEVETLEGLEEALQAGADIVLLDNMTLEMTAEAVRRKRALGSSAQLEASGGITLENLPAFAKTGVERISLGALTHSAPAADVSLTLYPKGAARE